MKIYTIYIFDNLGNALYYHEWFRARSTQQLISTNSQHQSGQLNKRHLNEDEDCKLMRGLLLTLKEFCARIAPASQSVHLGQDVMHFSYVTSKYKLHFSEAPTGLKIVLTTDPLCPSLRENLQYIYSGIFVPNVVKNPLYNAGDRIPPAFGEKLDEYIQSLQSGGKAPNSITL